MMWVDALGINRKDPAEQSPQVRLVQYIYSQARGDFRLV